MEDEHISKRGDFVGFRQNSGQIRLIIVFKYPTIGKIDWRMGMRHGGSTPAEVIMSENGFGEASQDSLAMPAAIHI